MGMFQKFALLLMVYLMSRGNIYATYVVDGMIEVIVNSKLKSKHVISCLDIGGATIGLSWENIFEDFYRVDGYRN
jgi:signal transduction histidine kinase